jgi:hypothetical protein
VWVLFNNTPFSAERGFMRDRHGAEVWLGALRASFSVGVDGRLRRAERQTAPLRAPLWAGEPGLSSLLDDVDFHPKRGTDVWVLGHAFAPRGRAASAVDVTLRLGGKDKTVRVHGSRIWERSANGARVVPGPANAFERVPLTYELAFGGSDVSAPDVARRVCGPNPVGRGFAHSPEGLLGTPAPQLEHPGAALVACPEQLAPPGFGPIAPSWQPRLGLAGTYDDAWKTRRAPLPPEDFQEGFYRSAPHDQQLPRFIAGGEPIELVNVTPEGSFRVQLPELRVRMTTVFSDGSETTLAPLHTVRLLPDERRVELCWLACLPCQGREHKLLRARIDCDGERSCRLP